MNSHSAPSMRVLTRPPSASTSVPVSVPVPIPLSGSCSDPSSSATTSTPPPSSSQPQSRSLDGVVVVGFIAGRPDDSSLLINRIIDSNVFGSGNLDKIFCIDKEEVKDWFKCRRISYYHEEEKGVLFLQFCSTQCLAVDGFCDSASGFATVLEDCEFGDLQGLLFMFSVCHVIIYIQEGSRFDTQLLKKLRVLQASKNALGPYVRSRATPPLPSRAHSSSLLRPISSASSNNSPARSGGNRNASAISLMSGLGSYTSLFPGQCTPVTLFVFVDDFSDVNPGANVEDSTDTSLNQTSNSSTLARSTMSTKGLGTVVVLARPVNKTEGGLRRKLQSSLEAQIRFLIKKCRTLSGSESTHVGSRSGAVSSSPPLFSLDASRAVVLLDRSTNKRGESLQFSIDLVEDVLSGKSTSESLLHESHSQSANKEDILSVKEFIYRQSDILRGRGGLVNANSSSAAGVGMVAVAAAAAAASAASGKTFGTPELPGLEIWLSSSQLILQGILSAKGGCVVEAEVSKRKPRQRNTLPPQAEGIVSRGADPLDISVSWLASGQGLNRKFSTLWCERALQAAKDVYLKGLPSFYPTSEHEAHLEKAMQAFRSMVRGPAVPLFQTKLMDECTSIWTSGRQLCDAVSLTGKPCMHQRHDTETGEAVVETAVMPHSSGYIFLRACACGRSRRLQSDPFDLESANGSSCFLDCDKLLPAVGLAEVTNVGPIKPSSWSLVRVGSARYYEPSKGLLQTGFCATDKFLLKWRILLEKQKNLNSLPTITMQHGLVFRSNTDPKGVVDVDKGLRKPGATTGKHDATTDIQSGTEIPGKQLENKNLDGKRISFGRGLPNVTRRKAFSEVVAGSAATESGFPPLQQKKQSSSAIEKGFKQNRARDWSAETVHPITDQGSQKSEYFPSVHNNLNGASSNSSMDGDPLIQIGTNVVPVNMNGGEKIKSNPSLKHVTVYVGFEHECPHGHRFLLSPEYLNELGSSYALPEECNIPSSVDTSEHTVAVSSKFGKRGGHGKGRRNSNGMTAAMLNNGNVDKSKDILANGNDGLMQFEQNQRSFSSIKLSKLGKDFEGGSPPVSVNDSGCAFSMLNRNLPLYMNCPHCKQSKNRKNQPKIKFAGTVSRLQRIFMVTPPFPVVLATCPTVQFEKSCLPPTVPDSDQKLQFSLGCQVVLPPESFLALRLPFVYGVQLEGTSLHPLNPFENQPELTAWLCKGTTLQILSKESSINEGFQT